MIEINSHHIGFHFETNTLFFPQYSHLDMTIFAKLNVNK
jgi:hypothetical protein